MTGTNEIALSILKSEREVAFSRIRELLGALGISDQISILSENVLAQALEKISSLRDHAKVADETIANVRREHNLDKTRVSMFRADLDVQHRKNDEAYIEIETLRRCMAERAGPLSPPVTESEAALVRLVRQYDCINLNGDIDAVKAQSGLDFIKGRQQAGRMTPATTPVTTRTRPVEKQKHSYEEVGDTIERLNQTIDEWREYGKYLELELANRRANVYVPTGEFFRELTHLGIIDHAGVLDVDTTKKALENIREMGATDERVRAQHSREEKNDRVFGTVSMDEAPIAFSSSMKRLLERAALSPSGKKIVDECFRLAEMLIEKNIAYGDSALRPLRLFAKDIDTRAQILVRLDDKLSRLARGSAAGEDVILDLLGYLILYRIAPVPAVEKPPSPFDNLVVRPPTPEEVVQLRETAAESEKNSPYRETFSRKLWFEAISAGDADALLEWFRLNPKNKWVQGGMAETKAISLVTKLRMDGRLRTQINSDGSVTYVVFDPPPSIPGEKP